MVDKELDESSSATKGTTGNLPIPTRFCVRVVVTPSPDEEIVATATNMELVDQHQGQIL